MTVITRFPLLLFSIFMLSSCSKPLETPEQQIDRLIDLAGVRQEILQLPDHIRDETSERQEAFSVAQQEQLAEVLLRAYEPAPVLSAIRSHLSANYPATDRAALLQSLDSPLADRIRALEQAARTENAEAAREAFAAQLDQKPPSDARVKLMQEYGVVTGKMDMASEIVANTMRTYFTLAPVITRTDSVDMDVLEVMMATLEAQLSEGLTATFLIDALFIFRDIPDAEVAEYNRMWDSEPGRRFVRITRSALANALHEGSERALDMAKNPG